MHHLTWFLTCTVAIGRVMWELSPNRSTLHFTTYLPAQRISFNLWIDVSLGLWRLLPGVYFGSEAARRGHSSKHAQIYVRHGKISAQTRRRKLGIVNKHRYLVFVYLVLLAFLTMNQIGRTWRSENNHRQDFSVAKRQSKFWHQISDQTFTRRELIKNVLAPDCKSLRVALSRSQCRDEMKTKRMGRVGARFSCKTRLCTDIKFDEHWE